MWHAIDVRLLHVNTYCRYVTLFCLYLNF